MSLVYLLSLPAHESTFPAGHQLSFISLTQWPPGCCETSEKVEPSDSLVRYVVLEACVVICNLGSKVLCSVVPRHPLGNPEVLSRQYDFFQKGKQDRRRSHLPKVRGTKGEFTVLRLPSDPGLCHQSRFWAPGHITCHLQGVPGQAWEPSSLGGTTFDKDVTLSGPQISPVNFVFNAANICTI